MLDFIFVRRSRQDQSSAGDPTVRVNSNRRIATPSQEIGAIQNRPTPAQSDIELLDRALFGGDCVGRINEADKGRWRSPQPANLPSGDPAPPTLTLTHAPRFRTAWRGIRVAGPKTVRQLAAVREAKTFS